MQRFGYLLPTRGSVLTSEDPQTLAAKTHADVVGLASRAESLGFESVWVGDSVLAKPRHEPLATLAALSTATESVDLGTAVHLSPLRHPVHLAHQTATVDQLSGGRLRLGVGVGSGPAVAAEFDELDVPFEERGARLDEILDVVTSLWSGDSVRYDGEFYAVDDAAIGFEPVRNPPIYVASSQFDPSVGFPQSIERRIVDHGAGWLPNALTPTQYADGLSSIRSALADAGRPRDAVDPAFYRDVVIDDDEERAVAEARQFYDRYYPAWDDLSDEAVSSHGTFGAPADVAAEFESYAEAGVETTVVRFTSPDQRTQLRRFADLLDDRLIG